MADEKVYIKHPEVGAASDPVTLEAFEQVWKSRGWEIDLRAADVTETGVRSAETVQETGDESEPRTEGEKVDAKLDAQDAAEPRRGRNR